MIETRTLAADDWAEWRTLRLAALADAPEAFRARLADWQDAEEPRWRARMDEVPLNLIADLDGRAAGMVSCTPPDHSGAAELLAMWVAPFARGHGVGSTLVDAVLRWAGDQGADRVRLHVMRGNDPAIALYERHGFADDASIGGDHPVARIMVRATGNG